MANFDAETIGKLLAIFGLGDEDRQALAHLQPLLEKHLDTLANTIRQGFVGFGKLGAPCAEKAPQMLANTAVNVYLRSLFSAQWDAGYFQGRALVGAAHDQLGVEPRWYLGGYALLLTSLIPIAVEDLQHLPPEQVVRAYNAWAKVVCMDIAIVWETYYTNREQRLLARQRELESLHAYAIKALEERTEECHRHQARCQELETALSRVHDLAGHALTEEAVDRSGP